MSLYTVSQKLRGFYDLPFWKVVTIFGIIPALWSLTIVQYADPTFPTHYADVDMKIAILSILSILSLACTTIGVFVTLTIIRALLLLNHGVVQNSGKFIGKSLATNDEFLLDFSKGVFPKLVGFIRGYNDPKVEALQNHVLEKDKKIEELTAKITNLETLILPHIARQNRNDFDQNLRIKNLEETVAEIKRLLENKQPEDNIPLDILEKLTNKVLKLEEEIKKHKGE